MPSLSPDMEEVEQPARQSSHTAASTSQAQGQPQLRSRSRPQSVSRLADRAAPVFHKLAVQHEDGAEPRLPPHQVAGFLQHTLGFAPPTDWKLTGLMRPIQTPSMGDRGLRQEAAVALAGMVASTSPASPTFSSSSSSVAKAPLKKVLKNRYYLESGTLAYDAAVVLYIQKLNEHRLKCEAEGRYAEAQAAAKRLADLKTAQVERLRQELQESQRREQDELQKVYEEETAKFQRLWDRRIKEYEAGFAKAVDDLKAVHQQQLEIYSMELKAKSFKPKPSKEYLNQKRIEESLARSRQYNQASRVKKATDELYQAEVEQAQQMFETEQKFKLAKFAAKQQQEVEALLQRGARGRDELELRRAAETERRMYRYRNILMELESLNKLEVVHLENFLDGQVQAGKAAPLKGTETFRRRREQLLSSEF